MTVIAPRILQVSVGPPGTPGRMWDQSLYIHAKIERTASSTPNKATVELYNLAPLSISYLERPGHVLQVRAGETIPGTLFFGELRASGIKTAVKHPNQVTTLKATDGKRIMQTGHFSGSYPAGTTRSQIVADVLAQNAIARGYVGPLPERVYHAPIMLSAPVDAVLDELYTGEPASWAIHSGRFVLLLDAEAMPGNAPIVSAETGMMGSPERSDKGVKVKTGAVGTVQPGGPFVLNSRLSKGTFKAIKVSTDIDTELKWEDTIMGKALK